MIDNLTAYLSSGIGGENSLNLKLNAIEWMVYQEVSSGQPLYTHLDRLESAMYGTTQTGSVVSRIDELLMMVWATDKLNVDVVTVPKETLVKIKLLTELDGSKNKVGDSVRYRVMDDIVIKDRFGHRSWHRRCWKSPRSEHCQAFGPGWATGCGLRHTGRH